MVRLLLALTALLMTVETGKAPSLTHTYLQDIRSGICAYARENPAFQHVKAGSPDVILNLKKAVEGVTLDQAITLSPWFVPKSAMYLLGFVALWMVLRKIKINLARRGKGRPGQALLVKSPCLHATLCIFTLLCIAFALFYSVKGILLASQIEAASASFICHFLHFPDQFSRDPNTPATFNDYQIAATQLGVSFGKTQQAIKALENHSNKTSFVANSKRMMSDERALESLLELQEMLSPIADSSGEKVWLMSNLREILLQLRGFLFLVPSFINSSIRIDKVPNIIRSSISQFYTVMVLVAFATLAFLCIILSGRHLRRLWILELPPVFIGCSFFTALFLALCGNFVLILGGNACNIFDEYPKKSQLFEIATKKVHFEEELMKATVRQILRKTQSDSDGNFATLDSQLYHDYDKAMTLMTKVQSYKPHEGASNTSNEEYQLWQQQLSQYQRQLEVIRSYMLDIEGQRKREGEFGRLSLRPYGNYLEGLNQSICSHNHVLWSSNHSTCLTMAFWFLVALLCYYILLCCSKQSFQRLPSEDQGTEMSLPASPSAEPGSGHVYV